MEGSLQTIRDEINEANLPEDSRKTILWCLGRLPKLYEDLAQTYDSRHSDEILRVIPMMLRLLADSPDGAKLAEDICARFRTMHEKLGIPGVDFKAPAAAKRPGRSKVASKTAAKTATKKARDA